MNCIALAGYTHPHELSTLLRRKTLPLRKCPLEPTCTEAAPGDDSWRQTEFSTKWLPRLWYDQTGKEQAMPLLDHFHPPLSVCRPWEAVHGAWVSTIAQQLNAVLPRLYVALP